MSRLLLIRNNLTIKYLKSLNSDVVDEISMIRNYRDMEYYFVLLCDRNKLNEMA